MYKANYHTHMRFCNHAVGDVIDYVKEAYELKLEEIGMTDHAPILESFMDKDFYEQAYCFQNMKLDTVPAYLKQIEEAKALYKNKINILSGFETEYLDKEKDFYKDLRKRVDYLNLGIHYYEANGVFYDTYCDVDYNSIDFYLETVIKALNTGLFNVLVHPDLFMFNYKDKSGNWSFDDKCEYVTRKIIEECIKHDVYVEINANGLKYSKDKTNRSMWKYPYVNFWLIAKEYKDLKILIGADAHNPKDLYNDNVKAVIKFSEDLGLRIEEKMVIKHWKNM